MGRYVHVKEFKHMRKALRRLKGYTGGVMRGLRDRIIAKRALISQLLHHQPRGSDKIYALHEPEIDCISKGNARARHEFGCRVSVATTLAA